MRTFVILSLALLLIAPAAGALDLPEQAPAPRERYIVGFYGAAPSAASYQGERVVAVDHDLNYLVVETANPTGFKARATLDRDVRYIELDDPYWARTALVPNDPFWTHANNYGPVTVGAVVAWDLTLGAASLKVAVTDSGILATHEDIAGTGRLLPGYDYYNGDATPEDNCGHGTHVLSTIASGTNNGKGFAGYAQVGVAAHKALEKTMGDCYGRTTALANAIKAAADQGFHFSSNSWSSSASSTTFNDAIDYAFNKGTVIVAAAGNSGPCTSCVSFPWKDRPDRVIIVSATNANDEFATTFTGLTSGSSQGPEVDVAAPGDEIGQAYIKAHKSWSCTNNCYVKSSGTSMAAPAVTGILALVKTLNPTFGHAELDARIKGTAVDKGPAGFDVQYGHGRVSAAAAVY